MSNLKQIKSILITAMESFIYSLEYYILFFQETKVYKELRKSYVIYNDIYFAILWIYLLVVWFGLWNSILVYGVQMWILRFLSQSAKDQVISIASTILLISICGKIGILSSFLESLSRWDFLKKTFYWFILLVILALSFKLWNFSVQSLEIWLFLFIVFLYFLWKVISLFDKSSRQFYLYDFPKKVFIETKSDREKVNVIKGREVFLKAIKSFDIKRGYIKPINDQPITIWADIFQYRDIAKNVYDILVWIDTSSLNGAYAIWVVWEWGIWKTSIINILNDMFLLWNPNFLVFKFNPWNYDKKILVESFLNEFSAVIWNNSSGGNIYELLGKYSKLLWLVSNKLEIFIDTIIWNNLKNLTLEGLKKEISTLLETLDRKVVIIIDDLDRCEPDEVMLVLNLVKNLWDFKNVIYLVSYDKEHIIDVLNSKQFDKAYIEKIINLEKFIPIPVSTQLLEYFLYQIEEIVEKVWLEISSIDIKNMVSIKFVKIFEIENLRFIKKLLNQINVILSLNKEKWLLEDFGIISLENLILINYIKLKDYSFYSEVVMKVGIIEDYQEYNEPYRPKNFMNLQDKPLYKNFSREFLWLALHLNENWTLRITNLLKRKDSESLRYQENLNFLKDFS